jgi:hypothetical protein
MEFLGSRQFETLPQIDFGVPGIGYESLFCEKQWIDLHKVLNANAYLHHIYIFKIALKTFHQVAFTFRFDTLPATTEQRRREQEKIGKCNADDDMYLNGEPFVIEVPSSHQATLANNQQLRDCLCRRTGMFFLQFIG